MNGNEIGRILRDANNTLYPTSAVSNVFSGGNVGMVAIALSIEELNKTLKNFMSMYVEMFEMMKALKEKNDTA